MISDSLCFISSSIVFVCSSVSSCTCFYVLSYDNTLGCLPGGQAYTFEDQFDGTGMAV